MLSVLLIDAGKTNAGVLSEIILKSYDGSIRITKVSSELEALNLINEEDIVYDIIFIDLIYNKDKGFKYAQNVRKIERLKRVPIIFFTDTDFKGLVPMSDCDKNNYIMSLSDKPKDRSALAMYLGKISKKKLSYEFSPVVFLNYAGGTGIFKVEDIYFAEVRDKKLFVHVNDDVYTCSRLGIEKFIDKCDTSYFVRCHRSYAVNVKKIKGLERVDGRLKKVKFDKDKGDCYVSKTYFKNVVI